jgi:hypothetical protein
LSAARDRPLCHSRIHLLNSVHLAQTLDKEYSMKIKQLAMAVVAAMALSQAAFAQTPTQGAGVTGATGGAIGGVAVSTVFVGAVVAGVVVSAATSGGTTTGTTGTTGTAAP